MSRSSSPPPPRSRSCSGDTGSRGRGRSSHGDVPGRLDPDDDRIGDGQLRALAGALAPYALRPHVRRAARRARRAGRSSSRATCSSESCCAARCDQTLSPEFVMPIRLNGAPRRRADRARSRGFHPSLRRALGRRCVGHRHRLGDQRRATRDPRRARRLGDDTRQHAAPAFGIAGPFGSYAEFGDVSKVTMIGLMWLGRLEIIPVVVLATRHYWRLDRHDGSAGGRGGRVGGRPLP